MIVTFVLSMTSIAFLSSVNSFVMLLLFVWFSSALTCIVCIAWISSDYFESLLLPLRGENDWKQSDEIQAVLCSVIQRCSSHDYWIILCIAHWNCISVSVLQLFKYVILKSCSLLCSSLKLKTGSSCPLTTQAR